MTRLFNDPSAFTGDTVDGFVAAYRRYVERVPHASGVMRAGGPAAGKVAVIVGGGSGHYPAFCGLVGPGLADGAVIGDIFTSPSAEQAYLVGKATDSGAGVLFSYGNYAGDVMNFGLAQQRLRAEGRDCRTVLVTDDIASAPAGAIEQRRGIAGDFCVFKIAGAAAERGLDIDEVERVAVKANAATFTLGAAFAGCSFPGADSPLFTVEQGKMELGLGIHGEPGVRTVERLTAAQLAAELVTAVLAERPPGADGRAAVILNGLGATKYEELFVVWKDVAPLLAAAGVTLIDPEVGELVTSLDMAGCSLTVCWLDDELESLWSAPVDTPAFRRGDTAALVRPAAAAPPVATPKQTTAEPVTASAASRRAAAGSRTALQRMLAVVESAQSRLGELDAVAGDGDHGRGMVRGLRSAVAAAADPRLGTGGVWRAAGAAWADDGAGTSGVLWGALLQAAGRVLGDERAPEAATIAQAVSAGAEAVAKLGGAVAGDKTMLDALLPFTAALDEELADGYRLEVAWHRAAAVALEAAESTRDLTPKVGRARPLADKSRGTPDPGAVSLALCAQAVEIALTQCRNGGDDS